MADQKLSVLWRADEESWNAFTRRLREVDGDVVVVLTSADNALLLQEDDRAHFLDELSKIRYRVRLATKEPAVIRDARKRSIRVLDRTRQLRALLAHHSKAEEALHLFSPSLWRQQWRSKLQTISLLSVPKMRILVLASLSISLFIFVIFRLLPAADVRVWPRSDLITQTMNITLVASGRTLPVSAHVRIQPLLKITARIHRAITFDDISPEFTGTDASVEMTIVNQSKETYSFRAGTRLLNQAGMIFRIQESVLVEAGSKQTVPAKADHLDLYDKITGARGNVPAGLQWEFPGLPVAERKYVFGKNMVAAKGGTTSQRTVLQQSDLDAGKKRLKQELLVAAKQLIEEERQLRMARNPSAQIELLAKDDVIMATYSGFILPTQFLGQPVVSVPMEGELIYSVPAYDLSAIQTAYGGELQAHAGEGKRLIPGSVHIDPEKVIIIEYADDGTPQHKYTGDWIKITADDVGTEQFVLDPLSPTGAKFGKKLREAIAGLSVREAQRILRNFPEVDRVDIRLWPPWGDMLPAIPSNITITPQR